ncbi:MAG: hypothetical protein MUC96_17590 [Myxococcaceae bacterium]|jgi:hypothetical protein|nr:hypothetical protein [Myxococcaceae bacterium]
MSDAHHDFDGLTRDEALAELARRGVRGPEVYLLDVLPLVEMAWSDGTVQDAERVIIEAFLDEHIGALHREAGVTVISRAEALRFVQRFLGSRPTAQEFRELRALLRVVRLSGPQREARAKQILEAVSNVGGIAPSPSEPRTHWDRAEVECMWELESELDTR